MAARRREERFATQARRLLALLTNVLARRATFGFDDLRDALADWYRGRDVAIRRMFQRDLAALRQLDIGIGHRDGEAAAYPITRRPLINFRDVSRDALKGLAQLEYAVRQDEYGFSRRTELLAALRKVRFLAGYGRGRGRLKKVWLAYPTADSNYLVRDRLQLLDEGLAFGWRARFTYSRPYIGVVEKHVVSPVRLIQREGEWWLVAAPEVGAKPLPFLVEHLHCLEVLGGGVAPARATERRGIAKARMLVQIAALVAARPGATLASINKGADIEPRDANELLELLRDEGYAERSGGHWRVTPTGSALAESVSLNEGEARALRLALRAFRHTSDPLAAAAAAEVGARLRHLGDDDHAVPAGAAESISWAKLARRARVGVVRYRPPLAALIEPEWVRGHFARERDGSIVGRMKYVSDLGLARGLAPFGSAVEIIEPAAAQALMADEIAKGRARVAPPVV